MIDGTSIDGVLEQRNVRISEEIRGPIATTYLGVSWMFAASKGQGNILTMAHHTSSIIDPYKSLTTKE